MSETLRILHLEDNVYDAQLAARVLAKDGIATEIVRVDTREAFVAALESEPLDIILADYNLPQFDGLAAQELAFRRRPEVPFIFLSATLGEEVAIERLKAGATDYVLKQRIARLPAAVRRARAETAERAERRAAEEQLRRLHEELEQRVAARTAELAAANTTLARREADIRAAKAEAERANRAKSEFLGRMSHDLRTPLNAVLGFAQLMAGDDLPPEHRESVEQILHAGKHLLGLINEVLDIARIEAGQLSLSPEPVDVSEIVQHAVKLIAPLAAERDITLVVSDQPGNVALLADRQRLNQILLNLLANAVKYNRRSGRVTVSQEHRPDGHLRINVSDTGAGLPAEKLRLLFTPFERLGAEGTSIEGTGLGLVVSRRLAEAMGGTLGVASEVDRGSTFWVELKVTESATAATGDHRASGPAVDAESVSGVVLYVEDNTSNVRLMERLFKRRPSVTLLHAATGHLALTLAREQRPDVIFLDLHLPDMHGEEVLRLLWEDPALRGIPVVVISADATSDQARRLKAAGATAYLTKPLDIGKVFGVLDGLLTGERGRGVKHVRAGAARVQR